MRRNEDVRCRIARTILVRDSEVPAVTYFFSFFFLIGAGLALGRATADALFFKRYGIEYLPFMYIALSVSMAAVSVVYAAHADRISAERFFQLLLGILITSLLISWLAIRFSSSDMIYPAYFLLYEITSELLLVHASLYLAHNFESLQAKRLLPLVLAGGQVGMISGGLSLAFLTPFVGVPQILLLWALLAVTALFAISAWHRRRGSSPFFRPTSKSHSQFRDSVKQVEQGLRLMKTSPLLRAASFALFFMVITFYVLCYSVNLIYTRTFQTEEQLSAFFGLLAAVNGGLALAAQIFLTNRVIRRAGVQTVNLIFPATSLISYAALLFTFSLPAALLASFNKDAIMPAFRNPVRNIFLSALPSSVQGRARATSVVAVLPAALLAAGAFLWLAQRTGSSAVLVALGAIASAAYLYFSVRMNRAYLSEIVSTLHRKLRVPAEHLHHGLRGNAHTVLPELSKGLASSDPHICAAYATALLRSYPEEAGLLLLSRMDDADDAIRDRLLPLITESRPPTLEALLLNLLRVGDTHLQSTVLRTLADLKTPTDERQIRQYLESVSPRLQSAAVYYVIRYPWPDMAEVAKEIWRRSFTSPDHACNWAALELAGRLEAEVEGCGRLRSAFTSCLTRHLASASSSTQLKALQALGRWEGAPVLAAADLVRELALHPSASMRSHALQCFNLIPEADRLSLCDRLLGDPHPKVRNAAAEKLRITSPDRIDAIAAALTDGPIPIPRRQRAVVRSLLEAARDHSILVRIAERRALDAYLLQHALRMCLLAGRAESAASDVFVHALGERRKEMIDLALAALSGSEDPELVGIARAGIRSRDPRHIANACDVVRELRHRWVASTLGTVIEHMNHPSDTPVTEVLPFENLGDVFTWCSTTGDAWLRECALAAEGVTTTGSVPDARLV